MAAKTRKKATAKRRKSNDPGRKRKRTPRKAAAAPRKRRKAARRTNAPAPRKRRKSTKRAAAPTTTRRRRRRSTTARRPNAPARRRRRRSNPGAKDFFGRLIAGFVDAGKAAVILIPALVLKNGLGNAKLFEKKDPATGATLIDPATGKAVMVGIAERVGPWYDVLANTLLLAVVPPLLPKVGLGKLAEPGRWALRINWLVSAVKLGQWYARHEWNADKPALLPGTDKYPGWTDLLDIGSKSLGTPDSSYVGGHYFAGRQPLALPGGGTMGMYPQTAALDAIYGGGQAWRQ